MPIFEISVHQPVLESVVVRVKASAAVEAQIKAVAKANDGCYDFGDGEAYGTAYVAGCLELREDEAIGTVCDTELSCSDPTEALGKAVENLLAAAERGFAASQLGDDLRNAFERWRREAR